MREYGFIRGEPRACRKASHRDLMVPHREYQVEIGMGARDGKFIWLCEWEIRPWREGEKRGA